MNSLRLRTLFLSGGKAFWTKGTMILSVLSSPALVSGLMVARAKNPVHSVLFPIPVFRDTSGLLILLGLDFSAMIFPVVHIGAIAVSFLFVVMMFHIQIAEIHEEVLRYLPVSGIIGLILWWEMFFILDNETIPLLPTQRNTTSLRYTVYAGKVEYEAISKETVCQVSAKVRPSRGDLLVVPKELLIQKESRELNVGSELAAPIYGKKKLLLTCKDGKSGDETRRDWLHECLAQNLNSWLSRIEAFPNGTNAAAPSVQSSHDFALVVRGLPNRTKMDRAVGSEKQQDRTKQMLRQVAEFSPFLSLWSLGTRVTRLQGQGPKMLSILIMASKLAELSNNNHNNKDRSKGYSPNRQAEQFSLCPVTNKACGLLLGRTLLHTGKAIPYALLQSYDSQLSLLSPNQCFLLQASKPFQFRGVEKWSSDFVVPDWYKSQMVNLVSKGKVRIELMVGMCRFILPSKGTLNEGLIYRKQAIAMGISHVLSLRFWAP
ncbi:NADH dehydrogenase subunit [Trifolium repens]|nr:NADH dehydrogenase subunit [Trifolium repens]